jgi:hypothetical protein
LCHFLDVTIRLSFVIDRFIAESKNAVPGTKAQAFKSIKNSEARQKAQPGVHLLDLAAYIDKRPNGGHETIRRDITARRSLNLEYRYRRVTGCLKPK